jgi:hypothetical protein
MPELFGQIESAYEKKIAEIKGSDHWFVPQYFTRSKLKLISDAEIPRALARLALRKAQLAYYEKLKDILLQDQKACEGASAVPPSGRALYYGSPSLADRPVGHALQ